MSVVVFRPGRIIQCILHRTFSFPNVFNPSSDLCCSFFFFQFLKHMCFICDNNSFCFGTCFDSALLFILPAFVTNLFVQYSILRPMFGALFIFGTISIVDVIRASFNEFHFSSRFWFFRLYSFYTVQPSMNRIMKNIYYNIDI